LRTGTPGGHYVWAAGSFVSVKSSALEVPV
jgi:hypothetical protein